jgi:hypothetical protein
MNRLLRLLLIPVCCLIGVALFAEDKVILLGKTEQWAGFRKTEGLTLKPGRGGFADLILSDSEYRPTPATDLLLHFNSLPIEGETPYYAIVKSTVGINAKYSLYGQGAAVFTGATGGIVLRPGAGSLLAPGTLLTDFSIEFWLYPAALVDGESVFAWKGFRMVDKRVVPQTLECRAQNRSLVWVFDNFFSSVNGEQVRFEINGIESLIPRQWRHHLLRYHSETGVLEYLVDGVPVGTRYATVNGRESSAVCLPVIGDADRSELTIGSRLTGFLDELRVSREFVKSPLLRRYTAAQGRAVSRVYDLGYSGTLVKSVNARYEKPSDAEINFYVRVSDAFNTFDRLKEDWIPFLPGQPFTGRLKGRYLQLMVEFFPDGKLEATPRLFEMAVVYEPDLAPGSPADLKVVPGNGKVLLSWKRVTEDDVKGYFIFYGDAPLNYQGEDARQGPSPINVGNVTSFELTGLSNGKLYFFTVVAYDSSSPPHLSDFIQEKSARPSEVLK